jgi:hypothetical protein
MAYGNIFSMKGGHIMHTDQMTPKPMTDDDLDKIKKGII